MHEVLMKTMCSNHSNTLLQPSKLPSCNSENYEGRKWWNCTKLEWHDRPWRECQEYHQFQCLYEGLCWSCDHVLKWPWPCLQHSGASGSLIDVFGNRHSLCRNRGILDKYRYFYIWMLLFFSTSPEAPRSHSIFTYELIGASGSRVLKLN